MKQCPICPVCHTSMKEGEKCRICGYSESTNYETHKTLGLIQDKESIALKNYLYENREKEGSRKPHQEECAAKAKDPIVVVLIVIICALVIVCAVLFFRLFVKSDDSNDPSGASTTVSESDVSTDSSEENNESTEDADSSLGTTENVAEIGDTITFGSYEQNNNLEDGKEDIEWEVLDKQDGKLLVISKYILDSQPYNEEYTDVTWETCTLRNWLNDDFLYSAFSSEERDQIAETNGLNGDNSKYKTDGGNDTTDQIFLLSANGAGQYFDSSDQRKCQATDYAKAQGIYVSEDNGMSWWWLRSAGNTQKNAAYICTHGDVDWDGGKGNKDSKGNVIDRSAYGVRPAMWIKSD